MVRYPPHPSTHLYPSNCPVFIAYLREVEQDRLESYSKCFDSESLAVPWIPDHEFLGDGQSKYRNRRKETRQVRPLLV